MNQAINFFWTILCFLPVIAFWIIAYSPVPFWVLTGISLLSLIIPARALQLSDKPKFYEAIGVKFIRKFVQNGDYVNRYLRKNHPGYRVIKGRAKAAGYLQTVILYERYHFFCFIFFVLTAAYAIVCRQYFLAFIITLSNIIYNISPVLLQQYNRARLARLKIRYRNHLIIR